mgnify:CR=1 FL=1
MKRSYIARRFQSSGAGLSLDTEALAKYKDIINRSNTYPTTRFVEDLDEFVFSAISVGYDFSELNFVKRSPIDRLRLSFNMNDIGRISTVKQERGTEYPFARTFSFSLSASF